MAMASTSDLPAQSIADADADADAQAQEVTNPLKDLARLISIQPERFSNQDGDQEIRNLAKLAMVYGFDTCECKREEGEEEEGGREKQLSLARRN